MPRSKKHRIYRNVGLTPRHDRWVREQMGDGADMAQVIEDALDRVMRLQSTIGKLGDVLERVTLVEGHMNRLTKTVDRLKTAEEFRIWNSVSGDIDAYNRYLSEFEIFMKDEEV